MGGTRVLVGTRKGAFVLTSDERPHRLEGRRPALPRLGDLPPQGLAAEPRPDLRLAVQRLVRPGDPAVRRRRLDLGAGGQRLHATTASPASTSGTTARCGRGRSPGSGTSSPRCTTSTRSTPGVEDAALFKSTDGGVTWAELSGLRKHDTGPQWQPGAGGMCLHTIIQHPTDPDRLYVAISAAGAFRTDRRRPDLAADQQGPAVRRDPRPGLRGRPLRAPHRHAPGEPRRPLHAEALGRHAQQGRRRLLAGGQRQPAQRLRLPDRGARSRARDDLRRADHSATPTTSRRTASCASTAAAPAATSGRR